MTLSILNMVDPYGLEDNSKLVEIRSCLACILKNRPDEGKEIQIGIEKLQSSSSVIEKLKRERYRLKD